MNPQISQIYADSFALCRMVPGIARPVANRFCSIVFCRGGCANRLTERNPQISQIDTDD